MARLSEAEDRCILANQPAEQLGLGTLPDGEQARYLDYYSTSFPSHWGEEDQGMKSDTIVRPVNHCTGVQHTVNGTVTSTRPPTTASTKDHIKVV